MDADTKMQLKKNREKTDTALLFCLNCLDTEIRPENFGSSQ